MGRYGWDEKPRYVVEMERDTAIRRAEKAEAALAVLEARMAQGPGKYDGYATWIRELTDAAGVCVMVIGGNKGTGFSVQVIDRELAKDLPRLLRLVADNIDQTENPADS